MIGNPVFASSPEQGTVKYQSQAKKGNNMQTESKSIKHKAYHLLDKSVFLRCLIDKLALRLVLLFLLFLSSCAFVPRTVDLTKIETRMAIPPDNFSNLYHVRFGIFEDKRQNKDRLGFARNKLMMITTTVSLQGNLSNLYEQIVKKNFASVGIGEGDSELLVKGSMLEAKTDALGPDNIYVQIKTSLTIINAANNIPIFNKVLKGYQVVPVTQISNFAWEEAFVGAMNQINDQIQLIAVETINLFSKSKPDHYQKLVEAKKEKAQNLIDVLIEGFDDGIRTSKQQDRDEALMNAKLQAIERAGTSIASFTKVENFTLKKEWIESKAKAVLLPGFQIIDKGYQEDGTYLIILSGKIKVKR